MRIGGLVKSTTVLLMVGLGSALVAVVGAAHIGPTRPALLDSNVTARTIATTTDRPLGSCEGPSSHATGIVEHAQVQAPKVTLSRLPAGSTLSYNHLCAFPNDTVVQINLPGNANANTVPSTGIPGRLSPSQLGAYHPASFISVIVIGGLIVPPRSQPTTTSDPLLDTTVATIDVQGNTATAWYPSNEGLGGYNIAWVEDGDYVQVQTTRGQTDAGEAGVSLRELEDVANGLRLG